MDLVYIAVIPEEPVRSELRERMEDYSALLGSKKALRNPPHITLAPPFLTQHYEQLISDLQKACEGLHPFSVELEGLRAFSDRVLFYPVRAEYIHLVHDAVIEVTAIHREHRIQKDFNLKVSKRKKELLARYGEMHVKEYYEPHMTLAKSDLDRVKLKELITNKIDTPHFFFEASAIQVLRQQGHAWVVDREIPLTQEEF